MNAYNVYKYSEEYMIDEFHVSLSIIPKIEKQFNRS